MLDVSLLTDRLRAFSDEQFSGFTGWPQDEAEAAEALAGAMAEYAAVVIPASTTVSQAETAMVGALAGMNAPGAAPAVIPAAFAAFATALAPGMAAAGFTATPPAGVPALAAVAAAGLGGASAETCLSQVASIVDIWMKTGTATPTSGGAPINWS